MLLQFIAVDGRHVGSGGAALRAKVADALVGKRSKPRKSVILAQRASEGSEWAVLAK